MADILPFRGLIYDLTKVGDLSLVTAPPYDVISEKAMPQYYARHPYNVIRLELGDPSSGQDRYRLCSRYFSDWEKKGILIREREPAFYFYQVDFPLDEGERKIRQGFIGLCRLEEFGKGMIFPHERIHEEQKEDRLEVLKACQANLSQIFSVYPDAQQTVNSLFRKYLASPPLFEYMDGEDIRHTLWSIKDRNLLRQVRERMKEKPLFIADGHHRYEAALAYKRGKEDGSSSTGKELFHYAMMYFCPFEDEGLTILPSHRLIFNLPQFDRIDFESQLEKYFEKRDFPFTVQTEAARRIDLFRVLGEGEEEGNAFGLYIHGNEYYTILQFKKDLDIPSTIGRTIPAVLRKLDVIVLHRFILEQLLNIAEKDQDQNRIRIIKNRDRAIDLVKEGAFQMAFLLNPPRVEKVQEVASEGKVMPQKSTFFYPKLPTGLVINKIVPNEAVDDLIP
jgi:uncharacterized protein (DUF1015 family)